MTENLCPKLENNFTETFDVTEKRPEQNKWIKTLNKLGVRNYMRKLITQC